jgi:hypothetical protein
VTRFRFEKIAPLERAERPGRFSSGHKWPRAVPFGAFTAYRVYEGNALLGVVASMREEAYRMAGRLRYPTGVHRYWAAQSADGSFRSSVYYSRDDAARALHREYS